MTTVGFKVLGSGFGVRGSAFRVRRSAFGVRRSADIVQSLAVRIAIGADHAGFALKEHFKSTLARLGHSVDDHGTDSDASVDYPPICAAVGRAVASGAADRGIVLGGSGQGEQIAAN